MTTIVYSNGILAADTRRTRTTTYKEVQCKNCTSKVTVNLLDNYSKIKLMPKTTFFHSEKILAVATLGRVSLCTALLDSVENNLDPISEYKAYKKYSLKTDTDDRIAGLIIITNLSLFKLHVSWNKQTLDKFKLDTDFSIGDVSGAANFYLKMIKRDAVQATIAAMCVDDHTGGNVDWLDINEAINQPDKKLIQIQTHITDMDAFALSMKTQGNQSCSTNPMPE